MGLFVKVSPAGWAGCAVGAVDAGGTVGRALQAHLGDRLGVGASDAGLQAGAID